MTDIKIGYGLRHIKSGKVLGYCLQSNSGGEFCCSEQHILSDSEYDRMWIVEDKLTAGYVRMFSTPWYNAGYETPTNNFKSEELEVVEIKTIVSDVQQPRIPTFEEYMERKYNNPSKGSYNPSHYKMIMEEHKKGRGFEYTIYDLMELEGRQ